jgi:hypothetical protein
MPATGFVLMARVSFAGSGKAGYASTSSAAQLRDALQPFCRIAADSGTQPDQILSIARRSGDW